MKTKVVIKDMPYITREPSRQVKFTKSERELLDKICRLDFLMRKSLVWIPSISELYETISKSAKIFNIQRTNNYYDEGFKSGFLIGLEISGNKQTPHKILKSIFNDS